MIRRATHRAARPQGVLDQPYRYPTDHSLRQVRDEHPDLPPDTRTTDRVRVAGRLALIRHHGGLTFATLRDRTGTIQLFVDTDAVGAAVHRGFDGLDRGDWVGAEGTVMTTRRGELSVAVESVALLGKALAEPPDKYRGLADVETRYRQRYLDLECNERTRQIFRIRHTAVLALREHLAERGFTEVEGPVLQSIQGGATARPFVTHHNALDLDMYLRIALELHLKRLIVGGMERVFEIGRVFRNEGIDTRHNPEFTMLEAYQAFADYHDMMDLAQGMVVAAARAALGDDLVVRHGGHAIDLGAAPWPRKRFADMIEERTGERMHPGMPIGEARAVLDRLGLAYEGGWGAGRLMKEVYDEKVQHDVVGPVFCIDYPREVSPLARRAPRRPGLRRALRADRRRVRAVQRLQRAERPGRAARRVRGRGAGEGRRRPRGRRRRPRLHPRARAGHAVHRRPRHRDRPAGDAAGERGLDPRGHPLPHAAPGVHPARRRARRRAAAAAQPHPGADHARPVTVRGHDPSRPRPRAATSPPASSPR